MTAPRQIASTSLFFEEQRPPDAMFYVEPAVGDGDVNLRVLIKLAATCVQGAEDAGLNAPAGVTSVAWPVWHRGTAR